MALGDQFTGLSSLAQNAVLDIRPASGVEAIVHNVYYSNAVQFIYTDGTTSITFDTDAASGARLGAVFHVNNTRWLQIKATATGTTNVGYDGVISK